MFHWFFLQDEVDEQEGKKDGANHGIKKKNDYTYQRREEIETENRKRKRGNLAKWQ